MKIILTLLLGIFAFPAFSQSSYTWKEFPNSKEITVANAGEVKTFENTMQSVVDYFYASRIRKDSEWEKVVPVAAERSERMLRELTKYDTWTITKYHIVSSTEFEPGKFWVKIYMEISIDGRTKGATDEADVELINGKWVITSVPT
jgi:hypothetical protein